MLTSIYNYLPLTDRLATSGQPTADQFKAIHQAGFEVVINLALPSSDNALSDERSRVESYGMTYISIPVVWEAPTVEAFQTFTAAMAAHPNQKILVHCAANMRVSAFMYAWRIQQGIASDKAMADLHKIWQPNATWQALLDQLLGDARWG
ncbi:protein tyrosine phosphatase family protein [Leptolyngbya sp. PCC 6406]|uniref:protein tyrosine phosphatase family protein n=1 Tax=Leptolyngbya sp. PCC 6406 TaxID=1173264 RepID=UPI0002ACC5E4|nr:protein tyrosine phosphatase family protein [Leptolyngbya sp. PCC 6406]